MRAVVSVALPLALSIFIGITTGQAPEQYSEDEAFGPVSSLREENGRILNFFTVVRFPNSVCTGTNSLNGTCYSAEECTSRGGTSAGTCAGGYGVCCTFQLGCGQTSSENCTYFVSGTASIGQCRLKICQCNNNICQLRLDFDTFVINQPTTSTNTVTKIGAQAVTAKNQCQMDLFSVTSPGNPAPPVICGTNSGEHMFVDSSDMCNDLAFNLGSGTSTVTRSWSIKITQYDCNYENLAPDGCTQYFYGATTDIIKTYNFDGGQQLASQNQKICIRRERNYCQICYATITDGDFELSGANTGAAGTAKVNGFCCNYGTGLANAATAYDCAKIPGASKAADGASLKHTGFCGGELASIAAATAAATICSKIIPFNIRYLSDLYETATETPKTMNGFRLAYVLKSC